MRRRYENRVIGTVFGEVHASRIAASFIIGRMKTGKCKHIDGQTFRKYLAEIGVQDEEDIQACLDFLEGKLELEDLASRCN